VQELTVIDGPCSSLYGPGFAFLVARLAAPQRFPEGPEARVSATFAYGSNGQSL
jgi:hypothetical protein